MTLVCSRSLSSLDPHPSVCKESKQPSPENHRRSPYFQVSMAEKETILKISRNLKSELPWEVFLWLSCRRGFSSGLAPSWLSTILLPDAVSAILQGYGDGQGPVTDTSAELHRLCGCLELLLQVRPSTLPLHPANSFPFNTLESFSSCTPKPLSSSLPRHSLLSQ